MARLLCFIFLGSACIAQAKADQGCPYPSTIRYVDGYFQEAGAHRLWRSPDVESRDFIDKFLGAVFIPRDGQDREHGYLEKCLYSAGSGQTVALRYGRAQGASTMTLTETTHWRLDKGALDQPVYVCDDSQPDNCAFTVD